MLKRVILCSLIALLLLTSGCLITARNGRHTGQITAIEQSGAIWPTWRAYVKTDISSSQEEAYCVDDASLIPKLRALSENRTRVTLIYHDELVTAPWRCDGEQGGIIDDYENIQ